MHTVMLCPRKTSKAILTLLLLLALYPLASAKKQQHPDFVPIADLIKHPLPEAIAISPDGRYLAGQRYQEFGETYRQTIFCYDLQERKAWSIGNGKYDNWIKQLHFVSNDKILVNYRFRDSWETFHVSGAEQKIILPANENTDHPLFFLQKAHVLASYLPDDPGKILVDLDHFSEYTSNKRNKFLKQGHMPRGIYKIDTETLEFELIFENDGETHYFEFTQNYEPRIAYKLPGIEYDKYGERINDDWLRENCQPEAWLLKDGKEVENLGFTIAYGERTGRESFYSLDVDDEENTLHFLSDSFDETIAMKKMDLATGEISTISKRPNIAVDSAIWDSWSNKVVGVNYYDGILDQEFFDPSLRKTYTTLKKLLPDWSVSLQDWDLSKNRVVVRIWKGSSYAIYFLYDEEKGAMEEIYTEAPWTDKFADKLSEMMPIKYESRDGLSIHGYLTLPSNNKIDAPYPTILYVHGGPWQRDYYGYDSVVQFLANRGYAVLQVNFRGSSGYSKAFLEAGNGQWGKKMQDDLSDAVHWAVDQGYADKNRIGIAGFSYGGYASMMGVCSTPELYAVGIPMMGVSDISIQISNYENREWDDAARFWKKYVLPNKGDPEALKSVSPLYLVKNVQAPLLLYHGRKDKKVDINHTSRFAKALRKHRKEFRSVYSITEGHSFRDEENLEHLLQKIEAFLGKHMPSDLMTPEE